MIGRAIVLLLLVAAAGAWGWSKDSVAWTLAGSLLGALFWVLWDSLRAGQLLRWLSRTDAIDVPRLRGLWGELLERSRKRFRPGRCRRERSPRRRHSRHWGSARQSLPGR